MKNNKRKVAILRKHLGKQPASEVMFRIIKEINENAKRETYDSKQ